MLVCDQFIRTVDLLTVVLAQMYSEAILKDTHFPVIHGATLERKVHERIDDHWGSTSHTFYNLFCNIMSGPAGRW
jgi:hypothetical protein